MSRCPRCDTRLRTTTTEITREVGEHTFAATVPATRCPSCGSTHIEPRVLERFDLHVADRLARAGVATGRAFRFMRNALQLRAQDLAQLLDLSPETLSRWENDKRPVDRSALTVLAACVTDALAGRTATLDTLRALRTPWSLDGSVRIELAPERIRRTATDD